ncbi:BTB/POZ and MATH domain-containing protein 2-like [Aegilops tauschii subsp. strangulata]|uniref:Speckle-type POZ protein-like protein n=1 Tax=Aegilops tauschii TaxID=37682 RepID=M8BI39_AEGTA|nr:BTB/POZ and MATH domain-containing protein 2-like [Aegilops tauschii subsp. strangulata]
MAAMDQPHTSSRCVVQTASATHDFVIANYSLIRYLPPGEAVSSGIFSVGGYEWTIMFYPGGTLYYTDTQCHIPSSAVFRASPSDRSGFLDVGRTLDLASPWYLNDDCLTIRCVLAVIFEHTENTKIGPAALVPRPDLPSHLKCMLTDGKGTDVTFDVGGRSFPAHRCLLAARSPVFNAELFGPMREKDMKIIKINDMEPAIFELLIHFVYMDSLPNDGEDCSTAVTQHLLVAADRYGLARLKQMCDAKLRTRLNTETVAATLALAEQHHCPLLREACEAFKSSSEVMAHVVASDGRQIQGSGGLQHR